MSNPAPRSDSMLARLMAKQTTKEKVAAAESGVTLNPVMERKVNDIVSRIFDDAEASLVAQQAHVEMAEEALRNSSDSEVAEIDLRDTTRRDSGNAPATASGSFRLPSESDCGLVNPDITLDESQVEAVRSLANHQYGCLIGAAGTGKTTVQKYLLKELIYGQDSTLTVKMLDGKQGLNIAMVAFTGMAVQVMSRALPDWMRIACKTIHALLEFEPEDMEKAGGGTTRMFMPQRNSLRKLDHDVIIIDEASMLGLDLWMQLLAALKPGTRIYMTGDLNQLPPIIGQPVFAYCLSKWPVYELTKVHRQKEPGANRIVEVAHEVLNGKPNLTFDTLKGNPDWRVIYQEIDGNPEKASKQIINILNQLRQRRIDPNDSASPFLYDPHKDRVMTSGNGYDMSTTSAYVQQAPLNERLSLLIEPPTPDHPRYIIDAGRERRKFSVGNRVMATKNETMNKTDRVTNGLAGTITEIVRNSHYSGNPMMFGPEDDVEMYIRSQVAAAVAGSNLPDSVASLADMDFDEEIELEPPAEDEEAEDDSGYASHSVTVEFDNGAVRTFTSKAQVESIQLAYCSTVAKCQGSQFDTAIIICHHAQKGQLSREWLYTAITRGVKRVIILGTDYAVRHAISKQKIKGRTLADKILRYQELLAGEAKTAYGSRLKVHLPLTIEDFSHHKVQFETIGALGE